MKQKVLKESNHVKIDNIDFIVRNFHDSKGNTFVQFITSSNLDHDKVIELGKDYISVQIGKWLKNKNIGASYDKDNEAAGITFRTNKLVEYKMNERVYKKDIPSIEDIQKFYDYTHKNGQYHAIDYYRKKGWSNDLIDSLFQGLATGSSAKDQYTLMSKIYTEQKLRKLIREQIKKVLKESVK